MSEGPLLAANEVLLLFFRVDNVDRARRSALKIRFSSFEFSARSVFLYSSTINQPDSDLSAGGMHVRAVTSRLGTFNLIHSVLVIGMASIYDGVSGKPE